MYSQEEIERKRQQALQRQQQKAACKPPVVSPLNAPKNNGNSYTSPKNSSSSSITNFFSPNSNRKSLGGSNQFKSQSAYKQQASANRYNPISSNKFYGTQQNKPPLCEAECSMISINRFTVDMSKYHLPLIEVFKSIPTRNYDPQTKSWNFHLIDYDMVLQKSMQLKSEVSFKGIPAYVLKFFRSLENKMNLQKPKPNLSRLDESLLNSLYPFQREGIEFGIQQDGKILLADDMGLGKTRQALGIAQYFSDDWPMLIISPSSVRYQWSEAIIENLTSVPIHSILHVTTNREPIEKCKVLIVSYDLVGRRTDELVARRFGVIICDESHYLKSANTQRTKAVQRLATNAKRIILLTGTPALSRPIELYPQIKMLIPNFMSPIDYGVRYCAGVQTKFGWSFTGSSHLKELEIWLQNSCCIRRLKKDVLTQLPTKIRQKIILDPHLIKTATKEMKESAKQMQKENLNGSTKHTILLQYYSDTAKAKEKAVCNYILELIENRASDDKFLVFAHHQSMLDAISSLLQSKKILHIRIDGRTNPEARKQYVDNFQDNDKIMVAVLSITAANAGLNLTAARLVIFAELSWNPGILTQAEDRVHRIGQTDNVIIRYLLAKETADDYMWNKLQTKIRVLNEVGLDQNFDMDAASLEHQLTSEQNQTTLDVFVESQSSSSGDKKSQMSSSSVSTSGLAELQVSSDSFKDLLDIDDEAFDEIDLDSIINSAENQS
ncbi:SWI/SNF-related matrix-associated actin-dependent regulator of chromatin subfamily A-like protein 1 [Trichogramma pretiosum]|uniref:SWI/SNF-related matrix-associated actin-dependent regulator of chromatin subfamily A-like protein 1 n=1 Tax=Trichogramma pretiosum TaxID=7493 RepID=UPI0006C94C11|nr:SWI/SNF-related matrix-associated actin-dependent regulator of chromatin subfamily A-like protein 1 [Trichogramma pretiosum]